VAGGLTFTQIGVGVAHSCGLTGEGDIYCWGDNQSGQLGIGSTTRHLTPVPVAFGD
jgi:alpha-tubulin suppressor-like RCC1 family protein